MLFVTSFSPDLFQASGRCLLDSYLSIQTRLPGSTMLVCSEQMNVEPPYSGLRWHDLDKDAFLQDWLRDNRRFIPDYLGGTARECSCPGREERHAKHAHGCHWQWMNRNASRWFRKVAALRAAATQGDPYVVWIDADAFFVRPLPESFLAEHLAKACLFYFRGHRPAVESGILGFDLNAGGARFIDRLCERYTSQAYATYERWDDGYQIAMLIDENTDATLRFRDLVHPTRHKNKTNDVIPTTAINPYIRHRKGRHGRILDIMK